MYKVIIERRADKEIETLPDEIIQEIIDIIKNIKLNPRPHGVRKLIGSDGWRIRIRDYRILYTIDYIHKLVTIYRVKHRREAYR